jgi:cholesterol oxidase
MGSGSDYDVVVVGSGFGGSVAALRLSEKGYRVHVIEAGRWFTRETLPETSWQLRSFLWAPRLGCYGIQRIHLLRNVVVLAGAGVGGGSLNYANTLYEPLDDFYDDPGWRDIANWRTELAPFYDQAKRMLGGRPNPTHTPVDEEMRKAAARLGVEHTFRLTPVGVFRGRTGRRRGWSTCSAWRIHRRPVLRGRRATPPRLPRMRIVHDRLPSRRQEHAHRELPPPGAAGWSHDRGHDHGHRHS